MIAKVQIEEKKFKVGDKVRVRSLEDLTTLVLALVDEAQRQGIEVKFERNSKKDASV